MIDRDWLGAWVDPRHLEPDALRRSRAAFLAHPARLLVLRPVLRADVAARLGRFLADEAEFQTARGIYSSEEEVAEERFAAIPAQDRFYRFGRLGGARGADPLSPGLVTLIRFRHALGDPRFLALFSEIAGAPLGHATVGVQAMRAGDFLHAHSDAVGTRRLAFVFYLSPGWRPAFGGALRLSRPGEGSWQVEAEHNSLALFDVTARTEHDIAPILAEAGEAARVTVSGWLCAAACDGSRGAGGDGAPGA